MAMMFEHSLRALEREHTGWPVVWMTLAAAWLAGWGLWMSAAQLPLYAKSVAGRLEVSSTTYRVSAATSGRVTRLTAALGDTVEAGDLLVELEDDEQKRHLDETRAQLDALDVRAAALQKQLQAERAASTWSTRLAEAAVGKQQLLVAESSELSGYDTRRLDIHQQLRAEHLITALDGLQVEQAAARSRHQLTAAQAELERTRVDRQYGEHAQLARIAGLERQLAELQALHLTAQAALATASTQLEQRRVYAPIAGRVGSVAALRRGDVVQSGAVLATLVPDELLQVVAEFEASAALGRIRAGQRADIYLDGRSVLEYGIVHARVREIASERLAGTIRVLLDLERGAAVDPPLRHGMPALVAVTVESTTPWQMVLRGVDHTLRTASHHETLASSHD